jgi:hypothetical protein
MYAQVRGRQNPIPVERQWDDQTLWCEPKHPQFILSAGRLIIIFWRFPYTFHNYSLRTKWHAMKHV